MSRASPRIKEMEVGRRTGLVVPPTSAFLANEGLENPEQLFDAAAIVEESPNSSVDGSIGKGNDASTALADFAAAESRKPKVKVRFSLGDEVAEEFDSTSVNVLKPQHPVRKLITGKNRDSIDTMDLSSVSTAPSVASLKKDVDEADVEASRQSSEELEIASIVAVAQKHAKSQRPDILTASPIITNAPDFDYDDDDDDLIPPPPPDSPQHDDVEEEEELHTQPSDENDVDFPNTVDDDDDGDDNDGAGFEINDDDQDKDDEPDMNDTMNEQRRRKEKRMAKLAEKKRSNSNKKIKKKNGQTSHEDSDDEDIVKPKSKPKKKINPYSTHFSPKGVPGPRTYTQIPLSDLKADTPDDTNVRRSKRVRVPPLEFWRGEKPIFGGNDFGDEYDGVKNMPVVVGIAKPDPTPYKKRKIVPVVSNPKRKGGENQRRRDSDDGPTMIVAEEPFDSTTLRQKLPVNDGKVAHLWDERFQEARGISTCHVVWFCLFLQKWSILYFISNDVSRLVRFTEVVSYVSSAKSNDLPMSKTRKKSEGKIVGKAAQSFQMSNEENPAFPGYIVGHLLLPPKGIKDAESVGMCAQVFTVVKGQANSIEVAYGDPDHESATWDPLNAERFLLAPGDNFLVPPGNSYRLRNHSTSTECLLSWTIIRHNPSLLLNEEE